MRPDDLISRLEHGRHDVRPTRYDEGELAGLPDPVRRYFRAAIRPGRPMITAVRLEQTGTLNMREDGERWQPFRASQRIVLAPPGFAWDARVRLLPGVAIRVRDAYLDGNGLLDARLFGLPLLPRLPSAELARGELMRFLAEAAWYPTALLPSQGVRWSPVGEHGACAELADDGTRVSLEFRFGSDGLIESVRAGDRGRSVRGKTVPTPWEGRWSRFTQVDGLRVPLEGEVAWLLPAGRHPYWRGRVSRLTYDEAA